MSDDPKHTLNDLIGPTDHLERVLLEKIEAAEEWLRRARALLELTRGDATAANPVRLSSHPQRYASLDPYPATVILLREQNRALSKDEIVEELLAGNVQTGSKKGTTKHKAEVIKKSLKANVNNTNLKLLNERYGFPDWPDEMFTS
jgi:dTDP-4-amino-4,6-dideoxygalactose transaminase